MPVATRSQISGGRDESTRRPHPSSLMRNPHHDLKEKMKALTQFYEQHQHQLASVRSLSSRSHNLAESDEKKRARCDGEEDSDLIIKKKHHDPLGSKENVEEFRFTMSCPRKELPQSEPRVLRPRRTSAGLDAISELPGSRIMVYVRLRPMARKEKEAGSRSCVKIVNRQEIYLTEFASDADYLRLKRLRGRHFSFDASFPESTSQQEVYATTAAELVDGVLQGRNGSVFCYGATGAGKTYTMLGTTENPGVMVLAIKELFWKIRQRSSDGNHVVHLSYLEVYNETVRDLLSPGRPLVLREDKQGIIAAGLTQYRAYSTDEVMALLQQGNRNRTTEPTRANETSSRSHAILQVVAEFKEKLVNGGIAVGSGKLSLIDLAGSERALATDQRSLRSLEGANINRSLLALSSCINALVEGKKHIPYRNSKLTQLLKDSLGGACNTVMIANISPSNLAFGETQNTLHWADRAKQIKTKVMEEEVAAARETEMDQAKLVLELQKENNDLRQQLAKEKQREKRSLVAGCLCTPESKKRAVEELQQRVRTLEAEVERLRKMKQKDELTSARRVVTRASLRKVERPVAAELKSPSHRFVSPSVKKRSFWDIAAAGSPSVVSVNARKTKAHVGAVEATPSLLLQPGFSRHRLNSVKR
ncbi:ATP binding microtubule motor family protein [Wolffia australiana]